VLIQMWIYNQFFTFLTQWVDTSFLLQHTATHQGATLEDRVLLKNESLRTMFSNPALHEASYR